MDLSRILAELNNERDRIGRVIASLLEGTGLISSTGKAATRRTGAPKRSRLTPAGRRKLSHAMKARWAKRRRANNASGKKTPVSPGRSKKRTVSAYWQAMSLEQRSAEMKRRAAVRAKNQKAE